MAQAGRTTAKEMEQGLGRLGFAANALTWERPVLGPLYAWSAAVRSKTGFLRIPAMLRTIFWFLAERNPGWGQLTRAYTHQKGGGGGSGFLYGCKGYGTRCLDRRFLAVKGRLHNFVVLRGGARKLGTMALHS